MCILFIELAVQFIVSRAWQIVKPSAAGSCGVEHFLQESEGRMVLPFCVYYFDFLFLCVWWGGGKFLTTVTAVCVKLRKVGSGVGAVVKCFDS